jgi:hypothetical protein
MTLTNVLHQNAVAKVTKRYNALLAAAQRRFAKAQADLKAKDAAHKARTGEQSKKHEQKIAEVKKYWDNKYKRLDKRMTQALANQAKKFAASKADLAKQVAAAEAAVKAAQQAAAVQLAVPPALKIQAVPIPANTGLLAGAAGVQKVLKSAAAAHSKIDKRHVRALLGVRFAIGANGDVSTVEGQAVRPEGSPEPRQGPPGVRPQAPGYAQVHAERKDFG